MTSQDLLVSSPNATPQIEQALRHLTEGNFLDRLFRKDPSIWSDDPAVQKTISNRLGWLDAPVKAQAILDELEDKLSPQRVGAFQDLLFLGMGGSSAFARILEANPQLHGPGGLRLTVLDSLVPDQVHQHLNLMAAPTTLIIVGSKSGGTVETLNLAEIAEEQGASSRMIAITDPGTSLETRAKEKAYWATFLSWADVGGRFSPLTAFGLVPAILVRMDVRKLVDEALTLRQECLESKDVLTHPAATAAGQIGGSILAGTDILNLPESGNTGLLAPLLEQLLAESIGKVGKGLWPLFRAPGEVISIEERQSPGIGAEIYRWQLITAAIGAVLELNPFDEPDVGLAKSLARQALDQLQNGEGLPWPEVDQELTKGKVYGTEDLKSFCMNSDGKILSLLLYLPVNPESVRVAQNMADELSGRCDAPVMMGFGPRYLHATGQLHKGGNDASRYLVVTCDNLEDLKLNSGPMLSELALSQALADVQALQSRERAVAHLHLNSSAFEALKVLQETL